MLSYYLTINLIGHACFDSRKGETSMAYRPSFSERLATNVAHETMRRFGWCQTPELMLDEIRVDHCGIYIISYMVWGDRSQKYVVEVDVRRYAESKDGTRPRYAGRASAYHCTTAYCGSAELKISWDGEIPTVSIGKFEIPY